MTETDNNGVATAIHIHGQGESSPAERVVISFHDRFRRIKLVLFLMFLVGLVTGIPSPVIPGLQKDAFGDHMFAYTGTLSAIKGCMAAVYTPLFGSLSDVRGRRYALALTMVFSAFPYAIYVGSQDYLAYAIADVLMGLYAASMSLSMVTITDKIPRECGMRTESFALTVCAFFLGLGCGPFLGIFMSVVNMFIVAGCIQLLAAVYVLQAFPRDDPTQQGTETTPLVADGAAPARCPFAHAHGQPGVVNPHTDSAKAVPVINESAVATGNAENATDGAAEDELPEGHPAREVPSFTVQLIQRRAYAIRAIELLRASKNLRIVGIAIFWNFLAVELIESLLLNYLQNTLNFSSNDQTLVIAILAVGALISLAFVVPMLKRNFGLYRSLQIAFVGNFLQTFILAFVKSRWEGFAAPLLGMISNAAYPCASALAAAAVPDEVGGTAQGVAAGARQLATAISPLLFGWLLNYSQNTSFPGLPFVVASAGCLIAFVVIRFYTFRTAV